MIKKTFCVVIFLPSSINCQQFVPEKLMLVIDLLRLILPSFSVHSFRFVAM